MGQSVSDLETRRDEIAKRYGGVLFNLAQENKTLKSILKEGVRLRQYLQEESRQWSYVVNPTVSLQTQRQIMESLVVSLKLGSLMKRFLMVLCQNRRLSSLKSILEEFMAQTQSASGIVEGTLETALKLTNEEMEELQKSLKRQLGKDVFLTQDVKESLLAGVVLRMDSMMVDASLKTRLNNLRNEMKG